MSDSSIPAVEAGPYPIRFGNRIQPLIGGELAFRRISEAVEQAQHAVFVTVASVQPDFRFPDGRGHLFDLLDRAALRGLEVRALSGAVPSSVGLRKKMTSSEPSPATNETTPC